MENITGVILAPTADQPLILVNIIGLAFSLYSTVSTLFKKSTTPPGTSVVKIQMGLSTSHEQEPGADGPGGHIPSVVLYNEFGSKFGKKLNKQHRTATEGEDVSVWVRHKHEGDSYPHYLSLFQPLKERLEERKRPGQEDFHIGGVDPVCISAIWLAGPDSEIYGWTGDIGASCGAQWYYSNAIVGIDGFQPPCVWLGRNSRRGGFRHGGMSMQITGFQTTPQRQAWVKENPKVLCDSPARFSMYTYLNEHHSIPTFGPEFNYYDDEARNGIDNREGRLPLSVDWQLYKDSRHLPLMGARDTTLVMDLGSGMGRSNIQRDLEHLEHSEELRNQFRALHETFSDSLVTSRNPSHSARTLCESVSSVGPDFVSLSEGLFCDMSQKIILPVCNEFSKSDCFDRESNTTRGSEIGNFLTKRESPYIKFRDW